MVRMCHSRGSEAGISFRDPVEKSRHQVTAGGPTDDARVACHNLDLRRMLAHPVFRGLGSKKSHAGACVKGRLPAASGLCGKL